ncbi:MAG: hypothetical protein V5A39_01390 [Haloarculaceae archaeon]
MGGPPTSPRSAFDPAVVEHHLRRLDRDVLAALVADLWEARGYETTRDGDVVVASHGPESVRIRIAPQSGLLGIEPAELDADVVVAPDGYPSSGDARVVDATALSETLGYGIDRAVSRRLGERHLGAAPADLPAPLSARVERGLATVGTQAQPAVVVGVLVVALGLGAVAGLAVLPDSGSGPATDGGPVERTVPALQGVEDDSLAVGGDPAPHPRESEGLSPGGISPDAGLPPGVTSSGIEDVDELAAAHDRALGNKSHTVWVDWYRPRNLRAGGERIQRDIDIAAEDGRYLVVTSEEVSGNRSRLGALYHDGVVSYAAGWNETNQSYDRVFRVDQRQNVGPTPETVRKQVVTRYLSTPTTNVTRVEQEGDRLYRVVGTGSPESDSAVTFRNYTVRALIDSRGFVHDLSVRATVEHPDRTFVAEREVTYGRVGTTTVSEPEWYREWKEES